MAAVDVITLTKDRPAIYLARALDDVIAQEHPDWHLYIGVDGSDPHKAHTLIGERGLEDRTTVVAAPEPVGIPALVNHCAAQGTSPFITKHDDDDTWHPQFLARTVRHLEQTDDQVVATRLQIIFEEQVGDHFVELGREIFHPLMIEPTFFDLLRYNHITPISMLFRREAWQRWPFDENRVVIDDYTFNRAALHDGRYGWIDEVLAYWHQRPNATGATGNTVIAGKHIHDKDDRRMRDERLRRDTEQEGALLYLTTYVAERTDEMHHRLDRVEQRNDQLLAALRRQRS